MYQTSIRNKKKHIKFQHNKEIEYIVDPLCEEYAYVIKMLGNCRVELVSNTGNKSIGIIRGTMRKFNKRILIERGDIVVISKRDYQQDKVDIVNKLNHEQTQSLINEKKISDYLINLYNNKKEINDTEFDSIINDNININLENLVFDDNTNISSSSSETSEIDEFD
jgi:initiation factor 1A